MTQTENVGCPICNNENYYIMFRTDGSTKAVTWCKGCDYQDVTDIKELESEGVVPITNLATKELPKTDFIAVTMVRILS